MRLSVSLGCPLLALALLVSSRDASASPGFPAVVRQEWELSYTPECTLCHATDSGGRGTVVTYFGRQMEALGVTAQSDASLAEALAIDKAQKIDSDGSGTSDYDDLVAHRNPSSGPGPSGGNPIRPLHGCAVGAVGAGSTGASLVAALVALLVMQRRRRARLSASL